MALAVPSKRLLVLLLLGGLSQSCAQVPTGTISGSRVDITADQPVPSAHASLDQVIAWVPLDRAPTAGVAQAHIHVALRKAKRLAEAELCEGIWTLNRPARLQVKPRRATAPAAAGGGEAWFYRLSREPATGQVCAGVDSSTFLRTVSHHLPSWMLLRPAYQLSFYQQGRPVAPAAIPDPGRLQEVASRR
jgi:hypothetical protein